MNWARDRIPGLSWTTKSSLPRRVLISYILDYVILVILFITFQALDAVEPYHQHFALQNYTLQYPFARHERVPIALAFAIAVVLPVLIIAFYTLVIDGIFSHQTQGTPRHGGGRARYTLQERLWELNCGILGLLLSEGVAFVVTGALKNEIGKPRPDLIDRCTPKEGSVDPTPFGLSTSSICTQKDHGILKDGFRSFPSGHSSSAFAGLFYLSLYLAGKLHVLDNRGEVWKTFVVLIPTLAAALIAGSRIMDARHHPFDVISGSLLGIVVAWCAYRQYFPPVSEPWHKGRAYPIRSWGTEPKAPRQDYQEMPRDHSPLELSRVRGQAKWGDPESGPGQAGVSNPLTNTHPQPWNVGDVSRRDFSNQNDGVNKPPGQTASSSSSDLERWRPPHFHTGTETARGRTPARSMRGGHDNFSSTTSSLHSHEVEELDPNMAPLPLSPSKSPQRNSHNFSADTAYHPPTHSPRALSQHGFSTSDDVVDSYICDHCGLRLHGDEERRNHTHV